MPHIYLPKHFSLLTDGQTMTMVGNGFGAKRRRPGGETARGDK